MIANRDRRLIAAGNWAARDLSSVLRWSDATSSARKRSSKLIGDAAVSLGIRCDVIHVVEYNPFNHITPIHDPSG